MLSREDIAQRILKLPQHLQAEAAEAALKLYGPAPRTVEARVNTFPEMHLLEFVEQGWNVLEPGRRFVPGWHLEGIAEHLEAVTLGQIQQLIINIPPRCMKSLLVEVFWPVWEWTSMPWLRYLCAAHTASLSTRDSLKCRRIIRSDWYQRNWGHVYQLTGDQNAKVRFENSETGYRIATSVGGTGVGEGGDRILIDDPHKPREATSDTIREGVNEWFDEEMSTRGNDQKSAAWVLIMQRLHQKDMSGHLLDRGGWEHLMLPMEYEPSRSRVTSIGWKDPRSAPGELLWPEHVPRPAVERLKLNLRAYGTAGQLQQRPAPAEGGVFKRVWWGFWQPRGANLGPVHIKIGEEQRLAPVRDLPVRFDSTLQSWDLSFGGQDEFESDDGADSAACVGQVFGATKAAKLVHGQRTVDAFLLDEVRGFWEFTDQVKQIRLLADAWPNVHLKLIERAANAKAAVSVLARQIPGMVTVPPEGDKVFRAESISQFVESGNVWLPHPAIAPWVWDFIEELAQFPKGEFKDRVDAFSQALRRLYGIGPTRLSATVVQRTFST